MPTFVRGSINPNESLSPMLDDVAAKSSLIAAAKLLPTDGGEPIAPAPYREEARPGAPPAGPSIPRALDPKGSAGSVSGSESGSSTRSLHERDDLRDPTRLEPWLEGAVPGGSPAGALPMGAVGCSVRPLLSFVVDPAEA